MAVIKTGYIFTENYLESCTRDLNKVRRICNDTCKYTKNFYEAQKKIYSLRSTKLKYEKCKKFPTLKMCAGNVLFHFLLYFIILC